MIKLIFFNTESVRKHEKIKWTFLNMNLESKSETIKSILSKFTLLYFSVGQIMRCGALVRREKVLVRRENFL